MFQKSVNIYAAAAVQGDRASLNPFVYTPQNYLAGENGVTVGTFVWESSEDTDPKQVVNTGTGAPLGFVERLLDNYNYELDSEGTLLVAEGGAVTVALRGDFYVPADTTVTVGMAVFASTTNGTVKFAAAGSTQSGYVETTYKAMTAGAEGDMIIISNEGAVLGATTSDLSGYAKADLSNVTGQLPIANGGTGVTAVGTAGQVLTTNSGADGTEWTTPAA